MLGAAFPFIPVLSSTSAPAGLWPNGYRYRLRRAIPAAIHQMPTGGVAWVKYRRTDNALRSVANAGKVENDQAWPDMTFENGLGAPLQWERESWNASTGAVVVYLRLINFVSGQDYVVLHSYGKLGTTADPAVPASCWAGYLQSVNMETGLDQSGAGRHFTLDGLVGSTIFGGDAGDFG
jgi:hypothetical protein